jgi:hypothetical protein
MIHMNTGRKEERNSQDQPIRLKTESTHGQHSLSSMGQIRVVFHMPALGCSVNVHNHEVNSNK